MERLFCFFAKKIRSLSLQRNKKWCYYFERDRYIATFYDIDAFGSLLIYLSERPVPIATDSSGLDAM